ncbi:HNH endonuclease family protein [Curtobacterium flaccumfaciens pv. oortii]|uniref:HNH endonuclease family protein n=1 Tax=Curtobacterium flaccumfaciens TaxID=2035 RepID=UPI00265B420E|nr:HNH endonuclease family protein [Curtobacterium flaccumfaciens]MCS5524682.1 HNH endonuclease family protein [Curtobacterium flaccumfaciens pv. oortii]
MRRRTKQNLIASLALVAAAGIGTLVAPYVHPSTAIGESAPTAVSSATAPTSAAAAEALRDLHALRVSDAFVGGYDRAAFGQAWADTDHNGCDTRNDVLRRDLTAVVTKPGTHGCVVLSGTLHDPYTGRTVVFHRGETSSLALQIDHRYPLALAWRHGASTWTAEQREQFANDQATNLVAVDGQANEDKSDSGPGEWMPPNVGDACTYATSFVTVATKWRLSIATDDEQALDRTLTECMTQGSKR